MDSSNVRKNPFGNPPKENNPEPVRNVAPSFNNYNEPPKKSTGAANLPPTKSNVNKEYEGNQFNNQNQMNNQRAFNNQNVQNQNNDSEKILEEYENIKWLNSSKGYIRPTTERIPANQQLLIDSSFPVGLIINPFSFYEPEAPVITFGDNDIPRCVASSCRAYINPFVKWIDGGDRWICNICKHVNVTENYYFNKLNSQNQRVDLNELGYLNSGSYDFVANKTYLRRDKPACVPTFVFLLDVSSASIQNGFLSACLESIKDAINNDLIPQGERIGIVTYDQTVNFYILSSKYSQPQCLSLADETVYLPTVLENLLVNLTDNKSQILNVIECIQNTHTASSCKDSVKLFHAINAGYLLCKDNGGKLIVFNSSNSIVNLPKMKSPNSAKIPKEDLYYSATDDKNISNMGINMTNENISCDIFLATDSFINLVTLNQMCDFTNGNLYFYKNFRIETNYKNIFNQIRRVLSRPMAWETVMRTRFSKGYRISNFITPTLISNGDLMILSTLDSDQAFTLQLECTSANNDNKNNQDSLRNNSNKSEPFLHIQSAVLYTHGDGTRRIRVHNTCLPIVNRLVDVFEGIDGECLSTFFLKSTIDKIFKTKKMSNSILQFSSMAKNMLSSALSAQQSLKKEVPENLVPFILYVLGALKNRVLCRDEIERKLDIDLSNYMRIKLQKLSTFDVQSFIYPRIYPLQSVLENPNIGVFSEDNSFCELPQVNYF